MSYLKNVIINIVSGALILVPVLIFIHFTYYYFSNYSPIPSIYYFYASMNFGPLYLAVNFYITGLLSRFFSKNLSFNNL
ncbi:MAG: hypothetical protein CBE17_02470 [Gammaproteobacteria bacterium TMED257]|nr:MAG: hypothetical protein CBE17_02470 [Gammaproteobacteria bacterium TMED257]